MSPPGEEPAAEPVALDGRALGARGARTRRRLLDATAKLLERRGVRDLRVVDVARRVGMSPATFYQYFRGVEDAVLALAEEVGQELEPLAALLDAPGDGPGALRRYRALVAGFVDHWDRHRAVLRTRNLAAQEGDPRFRAVRNATLQPLTERLAALVRAGQRAGRVPRAVSPAAAGAAMVALVERMAAFHRELEQFGVSRDDLVETTARIVHQTVGGRAGG